MNAQGKDVINLAVGSPDQPPSKATIDALCESARQPNVHGYQPYTEFPSCVKHLPIGTKDTTEWSLRRKKYCR